MGSPLALIHTLCLEFGGAQRLMSASPTLRPPISTQTDWPERVDKQPQSAFIDTTIEVGQPLILRRLVSRTQGLCEILTPLRHIPPCQRSRLVTCIDGWTRSHVAPVVVLWIMSVLKTWLSYISGTAISGSSCAGNEVSGYKKRIRASVGGIAGAGPSVLVLTLSSRRDRCTTRGCTPVCFDSHRHRRLSIPPPHCRRCMR